MMPLLEDLNHNPAIAILILGIVATGSLMAVVWIARRQRAAESKWKTLLRGVSTENFEDLLRRHMAKNQELEVLLSEVLVRLDVAERRLQTSKRFLGVVRFDAFSEVAGEQSFAMAVLDDRGDGAVISSLVGRSDCRVYCKALKSGKADRDLSKEELEAIQIAGKSGANTVK